MIALTRDLQKEIVRFLYNEERNEDLSSSYAYPFLRKMEDILDGKYSLNTQDANVRLMKSGKYSISLDISMVGTGDHGRYISVALESFDGGPFRHIVVFDDEMDEIETIEV